MRLKMICWGWGYMIMTLVPSVCVGHDEPGRMRSTCHDDHTVTDDTD